MNTEQIDYSKIKAIPTKYRGTQFRSRLEARWAAFFDLVGWRYEYEPIDLTGWIPDFALIGADGAVCYTEVKPIFAAHEPTMAKMVEAAPDAEYMMLLGARVTFEPSLSGQFVNIGMTRTRQTDADRPGRWTGMRNVTQHEPTGRYDIVLTCRAPYRGFFTGDRTSEYVDVAQVEALWAEAGNTVQWRARGN